MYRIFDNKAKKWVREGIYLSPNDDLSTSKKALFGSQKLSLVPSSRYTFHRDIGLCDKNNVVIFEGDICKLDDIIGVIAYAYEYASYFLFDNDKCEYYPLGMNVCKNIEVIGNVLEHYNLLKLN